LADAVVSDPPVEGQYDEMPELLTAEDVAVMGLAQARQAYWHRSHWLRWAVDKEDKRRALSGEDRQRLRHERQMLRERIRDLTKVESHGASDPPAEEEWSSGVQACCDELARYIRRETAPGAAIGPLSCVVSRSNDPRNPERVHNE